MIFSPDKEDFFAIFHILGKIMVGLAFFFLIPLLCALLLQEFNPFYDFLISFLATLSLGIFMILIFPYKKEIGWMHSFFIVSLSWLFASLLGALPLYLSSHFRSFLDAWFEAMSGFATTGLSLIEDLDHLSLSCNLWRHLMMFIGGQGIVLAGISLLTSTRKGSVSLYLGEARGEKIFPNIVATARFIWKVSFIYLGLGVSIYTFILLKKGLGISKALIEAFCLFFASFDTGGFTPHAASIFYYHSFILEIVTLVFMILGAMNFNLHFWVWQKDSREIFKNFEIKVFLASLFLLTTLLYLSLGKDSFLSFRKGFYQLISAHTGCGFTNLASFELNKFSQSSLFLLIIAMAIGGGVCSTTGGIKLMRLGLVIKAIFGEIKRIIMPYKAVYKESFHHLEDKVLEFPPIREAFIVTGVYFFFYLLGTIVALFYGYPLVSSLFESVSATANVGLSLGITNPAMPSLLKIIYIFQMWLGRLEFLSVFIALGYSLSLLKK